MPSIINSDDGVISGSAGLKTTGASDGITAFQQNGTESMRIVAAGNVGIGTSSPTTKLQVNGTVTATAFAGNLTGNATTATTATTANALNTANSYQVANLGVGIAPNGTNGDITAARSGGSTGVIFFGNSGARYLYYDGSNYIMPGTNLFVNGVQVTPSIGVGQTWTNVTGSRATGTTYTNSTGRPIMVVVTPVASGSLIGTFNIAGSAVGVVQFTPSGGGGGSPFFYIIPDGVTYSVTNNSNFSINYWWELR